MGASDILEANADADPAAAGRDYARIERAIRYVADNRLEQPGLDEIAAHVGLSPYHFQRLFTRWAGVGPKKFLQYLTIGDAKARLDASESVLGAALDAGLSGPGRLHDLFVAIDAVTPGEYKARGSGLEFRYGFHPCPFGEALVVASPRGVSGLSFVLGGDRAAALAEQQAGWDAARWHPDEAATAALARCLFDGAGEVSLLLRGTAFQVKVWEALLRIPPGAVATYATVARLIGRPGAARAAAGACAANRLAALIPCHRVIRDTGAVSGYRWGAARKLAMLGLEAARAEARAG